MFSKIEVILEILQEPANHFFDLIRTHCRQAEYRFLL